MDTRYPQIGSLRSMADRREAEAFLEHGATLGDFLDGFARWLDGLRRVFAPNVSSPHR
ncbi:MAG TPA: hypothetical protein VLL50_11350 [Usitatibacter sp.]|nr:hypothetical protein [Usitatibacter sp.]